MTIPRTPADLTAPWLSSVLDTEVTTVAVTPIGTGQTGATYRVHATYTGATTLPSTFAVKLPAQDDAVRERVALGYKSEVEFYTAVSAEVAVPVPACLHSEISSDGGDFVLVLADLAPAEQGDQLAGCTLEEAALAVDALAGLHGPSWCAPRWFELTSIIMPKPGDEAAATGMGEVSAMAATITLDRLGDRIGDADRETLLTSMSLVTPWLQAEPGRYSLLHGDYRLDNLLFDPQRTHVTVVDWQTVGLGLPARDLAYFTATSLLPQTRATVERDLVARYHAAVCRYGVTGYDLETCWQDYRLGALQAPFLTALGFAFSTSTDRGDEMILTMLSRGCRAVRELGTIEVIRSYQASSPTTA
ncbi:aminoglycoside phosphotransferase family protein [Mycolicibacterium sp. 018/SC-01/001]|uniref:phosphotransferase family protein n=1 Tax=Mycolicibacterium sp. 018/SC-01/001 TaxID=2592069 RepID=UPI0011816551|nr:aminoglycoside phosphotransferase family protein [Mycolicibacterium sp. 018/SC-01/001]TRW78988.1 aminoglycoside phosphotransferase family protein [Mycolicibacterium sp. 018/SC-01/001]